MSKLQGHLPPIMRTPLLDPSPARRPPLTRQTDWTGKELRAARLFQRQLFLRTTTFKIVSRKKSSGPAQLLRMIFTFGNIPYESQVVPKVDWKALQEKTPHGNLPVLWLDHTLYGNPNAIVRHLASHLGLLGKTEPERFVAEAVLAQVEEIRDSEYIEKAFKELCERRIDDNAELLLEVMIPRNFGFWENQIKSGPGPYILGSGISVADLTIYDFLHQHLSYLPLEAELKKNPNLDHLYELVPQHPKFEPLRQALAMEDK